MEKAPSNSQQTKVLADANLRQLAEHILDGNAVVFLGAGFSKGAKNISNEPFKSAGELSSLLCSRCGVQRNDVRLDDSSEVYIQKWGEDSLITLLKEQFIAKEHSADQLDTVRLGWKRIYTTNYDDIIESASKLSDRQFSGYVLSDNPASIDLSKPLCLHINGYIHRLTRASLSSELKLTDSSYARSDLFEESRWSGVFQHDLQVAKAIIFIGYSLYDIDIKRILIRLPEVHSKTAFILSTEQDPILDGKVSQYGQVFHLGLNGFLSALKLISENYSPRASQAPIFAAFSHYQPPIETVPPLRDTDIFKLLLYGDFDPKHIWQSANNYQAAPDYFLFRDRTDQVLAQFKEGKKKNLIVFSDLGNGKTLFLEGLKCRAHLNGYAVYAFVRAHENSATELDYIFSSDEPTLVIVEDVFTNLEILRSICLRKKANFRLVLSSRTSAFELNADKLAQIISDDELWDINLNQLTDREIEAAIALLNQYGLWGSLASASHDRKTKYLVHDCNREFQAILLGAFESPAIKSRIDGLFDFLNDKKAFRDFALAILILDFLGLPVNPYILTQLLEKESFNEISFQRTPAIKEFISFNSGMIYAKSAVLARHLLTGLSDGNLVIDCLIKMTKRSALLSGTDDTFHTIFRRLGLFSTLQDMLPEKNRRTACIRFFEELKNLELCKKSPHFWLQYAIARVAFDDYDAASTYYENAYSWAKQMPGFDTYHIDTHYARFLLKRAMFLPYSESTMEGFHDAHKILYFQANRADRDVRYYPYRSASLYRDFAEQFENNLQKHDIEYIIRAASEMLLSSKKVRKDITALPIIEKCRMNLSYILQRYKAPAKS